MSKIKKERPVVCCNCETPLDNYRDIAAAIRYNIDKKTGKYSGKLLKRIAELNPLKAIRALGKLATSVTAEVVTISTSRRENKGTGHL